MSAPTVILASGSPRRREILAAAGVEALVMVPEIDDAAVPAQSRSPEAYTMSLAWFKARQVRADARARLGTQGPRWIVAADTMCVLDGAVVGKPADAADAQAMIRRFAGRRHAVVTGVCILDRRSDARRIFFDAAEVALGELSPAQLRDYADSGAWRGKAGGYNFSERVADGWPIACEGDPETIMGLPSRLVLPCLRDDPAEVA